MGISTWVQFFRNFACVVKSLLPKNHHLMTTMPLPFAAYLTIFLPHVTISSNPDPSYIQYFISVTQFYVAVVVPYYAVQKIYNSFIMMRKLRTYQASINCISLSKPSIECSLFTNAISLSMNKLWYGSIVGGVVEFIMAVQFAYLGINSLQIFLPRHPTPVIEAVLITEIALVYFLYLMWSDMMKHYNHAVNGKMLLSKIEAKLKDVSTKKDKHLTPTDVLLLAHESGYAHTISEMLPALGVDYNITWLQFSHSNDDISIEDEIQNLNLAMKDIVSPPGVPSKASKVLGIFDTTLTFQSNLATHTQSNADSLPMDMIYFILNIVAFYGYMLIVVTYYYADSWWMDCLKFGLSHNTASAWGEFAGDLSWTIEPVLVIVTPYMTFKSSGKPSQSSPRVDDSMKSKKE